MNFLRTQSLLRIADTLKLYLSGQVWKTQSNLNLVPGRNVTFTQLETKDTSTLTLDVGSNGKLGWWGSFWDTTNQTITSTSTAYVVGINSSDPDSDGVAIVSGNRITPTTPANYNISVSIQLTNQDTQAHDATFWFRRNGTDIANSASVITVPATHGGINGHTLFYVDIALHLNSQDYVQVYWSAANTKISLETIAAGTSPVCPASPSVLCSVVQV